MLNNKEDRKDLLDSITDAKKYLGKPVLFKQEILDLENLFIKGSVKFKGEQFRERYEIRLEQTLPKELLKHIVLGFKKNPFMEIYNYSSYIAFKTNFERLIDGFGDENLYKLGIFRKSKKISKLTIYTLKF